MSFQNLYKIAAAQASEQRANRAAVDVELLRRSIIESGFAVEIDVDGVDLDEEVSLGHVVIEDRREERWDDETRLYASIRTSRKLNRCWTRFVSCKEMMHIFDGPAEIVDTREKFVALLDEIEAKPLNRSPVIDSEYRAEWMAMLVLCPKAERDRYKELLQSDQIGRYDVAWHFRIPQDFVGALMSEYYDEAYDRLIGDFEEQPPMDPNLAGLQD